jgi:hypothetical protein
MSSGVRTQPKHARRKTTSGKRVSHHRATDRGVRPRYWGGAPVASIASAIGHDGAALRGSGSTGGGPIVRGSTRLEELACSSGVRSQQQVQGNKHHWHTTSKQAARREEARGVADHRASDRGVPPRGGGAVVTSIARACGDGVAVASGSGVISGARGASSTSHTVLPGSAGDGARRLGVRAGAARC